jgi:serine/threonine-protein kinase
MFQPLKALNHFTIQRVLGRGGMGIVYLANDTRLGRPVALKVLDVYEIPDAEKKSRFLHEAQAAAAIRHPNIATIYEVSETEDGMPYIAMEYCEGVTISQLLRSGPAESKRFLNIARKIADGVAAAHRKGIVHRDIKSANIVLQDDDTIKILDFGLAKRFDASNADSHTAKYTSTGSSFFGTLPYISPEQAQGRPADRRSDLFSIGVVLYELATGRLPFDDESPLMVLEKIRDAEPAPFVPSDENFPPEAVGVISKLLQKNPDDRFQSADELQAELVRLEREYSPTHTPTTEHKTTSPRFGKTVRRKPTRPAWWMAVVAVALSLAAAMGVLLYRQSRNQARLVPNAVQTPIRSVAVLPFRNLSGNASDGFLSIGLADALVTRLQQASTLQVRPTSAVVGYQRDEEIDPKSAASDLQVDSVLQGRFLAAGSKIRVNLQLTDARTGYGVWAGSVDGNRTDLITLIDSVSTSTSSAITERLGTVLRETGKSQAHTDNREAYEHYLKARALVGSLVPEESRSQIEHLKRAVELDPTFAAAYAELAIDMVLRRVRGFSNAPNDFAEAESYARQAVRLDPNLAVAHLALGRVLVRDPERFRESVRENLAALRLNQNDTQALYTLATSFISTGEPSKADCVADAMARIDPTSNDVRTRGYLNINAVDPEGALRHAAVAINTRETALAGYDIAANAYLMRGDINAAEQAANEVAKLVPQHYLGKSLKAMIAAARGDRPTMEAALATFKVDAETNHWAAVRVALCYEKIGDRATALKWIERASKLGNHSWFYFLKHPWFSNLQSDNNARKILQHMKSDLDDVRDDVVGIYQLVCKQ